MNERPSPAADANPVAAYKQILQAVLERRPSGTRQRLAAALGKNRSFISQISSPTYAVPVPAQHIERIFEICHFSPAERVAFLDAYARAHPRRFRVLSGDEPVRTIKVTIPDLGDRERNEEIERLIHDFARRVARLLDPSK
jgi:hypothetical protein